VAEKEREGEIARMCVREGKYGCVCVCERERKRERGRGRGSVCVCEFVIKADEGASDRGKPVVSDVVRLSDQASRCDNCVVSKSNIQFGFHRNKSLDERYWKVFDSDFDSEVSHENENH